MASVASTDDNADWTALAACRGRTDLMFSRNHRTQRLAVEVCRSCPVRAQCLADVMASESNYDRYGIVGGLTPDERRHWGRAADRAG